MRDYERLLREFCELARLNNVGAIAQGSALAVNGVTFSISQARCDEPGAFAVYAEFGTVPAGRESAVYEQLLAENFIGAPGLGVTFGYSQSERRVICIQQMSAIGLTAQRLVDVLQYISTQAAAWQKTFFLEPSKDLVVERSARRPEAPTARTLLGNSRR
jgi:hypothetical protein